VSVLNKLSKTASLPRHSPLQTPHRICTICRSGAWQSGGRTSSCTTICSILTTPVLSRTVLVSLQPITSRDADDERASCNWVALLQVISSVCLLRTTLRWSRWRAVLGTVGSRGHVRATQNVVRFLWCARPAALNAGNVVNERRADACRDATRRY